MSVGRPDGGRGTGDAEVAARRAAQAAGVGLRELREVEEVRHGTAVFDSIWGGRTQLSAELAIAMAHSDNYVAAAFSSATGELVGALVGFRGLLDGGAPYIHSHILGVVPGAVARGVGFALKLHQRAWALERGIATIGWTFDPLVARNAHFNVSKLGAEIVSYHEDFYGRMNDEQNGADESDRVLVLWQLASKRATRAAAGRPPAVPAATESRARVILDAGPGGEPVVGPRDELPGPVRIQVPSDVVAMRRDDPGLAGRWRHAVRASLRPCLDAGCTVADVSRSGSYLLVETQPPQQSSG